MINEKTEDRAPRAWPRFMTARVAADYADTSPWTIRRHVRPCGRRGRSFVYAIEDVERWMRGQPIASAVADEEPMGRNAPTPVSAALARIRAIARGEEISERDDAVAIDEGRGDPRRAST